jgi:hypothetical protein
VNRAGEGFWKCSSSEFFTQPSIRYGTRNYKGKRKFPAPLLSSRAVDLMPISPSRVIRENHTRQTITKNSRKDNHKMK